MVSPFSVLNWTGEILHRKQISHSSEVQPVPNHTLHKNPMEEKKPELSSQAGPLYFSCSSYNHSVLNDLSF